MCWLLLVTLTLPLEGAKWTLETCIFAAIDAETSSTTHWTRNALAHAYTRPFELQACWTERAWHSGMYIFLYLFQNSGWFFKKIHTFFSPPTQHLISLLRLLPPSQGHEYKTCVSSGGSCSRCCGTSTSGTNPKRSWGYSSVGSRCWWRRWHGGACFAWLVTRPSLSLFKRLRS